MREDPAENGKICSYNYQKIEINEYEDVIEDNKIDVDLS